jgi:hypothetical protein
MKSTYSLAIALRTEAEQGNEPFKYLMAAAEFAAIGMDAAAQACNDRAIYYQNIAEVNQVMQLDLVTGEEISA